MNLRNSQQNKQLKNNKKEIKFQINDVKCYNEKLDDDSEDEDSDNLEYVMNMFGIDEENESISVKITGFKPRFYVNIPNKWNNSKVKIFIDSIKKFVKKKFKDSLNNYKVIHRIKFRGFTNNEQLKFIKLTFNNTYAMRSFMYVFKRKLNIPSLTKKPKKYELYETNIEPFIRFCHIQDIKPSGWVKIQPKNYTVQKVKLTTCQKEITCKWKSVEADENTHIAPLITLSFDIECDSSHGDFPLAKKNYKKLAAELLDNVHKKLKKNDEDKELYSDLLSNENDERQEQVLKLVRLAFKDKENIEEISKVYTKGVEKPSKKELLKLVPYLTKLLFIRIKREENNKELREAVDKTKKIWAEGSISVLEDIAMEVCKETGISNQKILNRIITRDILVDKITGMLDQFLPPLEGDKVIQIGSTIHRYGEQECFLKHIVTLDTCNPIDGAVVVPCKTEKEVLIEWAKFVRELDPDIVTGYNIFGFDFKFIYERAEELNVIGNMGTLGRISNSELELEEKNLSSSALGDNILTYIKMEGRVCLDLLKVVQKDHKLPSYKLDSVAENFISGSIKEITGDKENFGNILKISGASDLNEGNYITIFMKNDKYQEGKKFNILKIDGDIIELNEEIDKSIIDKKASWRLAKDDIGPKDIFRLQKQDAEGRKLVAKYCIQDCALCNKLINKLSIISNNIGMANVCIVPLSYIFLRGQGVKIFSLVSKECRENNFLLPDLKKPKSEEEKEQEKRIKRYRNDDDSDEEEVDEGGYEGAIVLPPNPGIYLKEFVTVLDYSSLYPSSMISENLSHDTYVMEERFNNLPGFDYLDITHDVYEWIDPKIKSKGKKKIGQKNCRFVQFPNNKKGLIPQILQKLLKARKSTRKKILYKTVKDNKGNEFSGLYDEKDDIVSIKTVEGEKMEFKKQDIVYKKDTYNEFEKEVLDGLQLAYKITANSLYGQIGARTSQIYLKDIAASTTATGRNLLYLAKEKTEERFEGAKIVYGDSVTNDTPLLLLNKITNQIEIKQIDDLSNEWISYDEFKKFDSNRREKQQCIIDNYQIYTSNGWSDIKRVIKHKTLKKIYRVLTHTGIVDVTEDHSLLDDKLEIKKPGEVSVGDKLYHNYPEFAKQDVELKSILDFIDDIGGKNVVLKKSFIYGFFYGDGSCGEYKCKSGIKYTFALNNKNLDNCLILQSLLSEIYENEFKILDTLKSSNVYKIVPNHNNIKGYVNEYRNKFYNKDNYKIIPQEILNASYEEKYSFFAGYYMADGYKCDKSKSKNIVFSNKGKIGSSMLFYLAKSIGLNVSINTRNDKRDIYKLTCTNKKLRKECNEIKKIDYLYTTEDYVYDIETETGNFNTGFELIVKNTDSIFINFNPKDKTGKLLEEKEGLKRSIELGVEAEKYIQQFLKPPHKLEYEKTFWPFILFTKKRYIGDKYEFDLDKYKQTSMGIVLKRRDNAAIVKHVYGGIMNIIMKEKDIPKSIEFLKEELKKLIDGKFPMEMLQITKSIKSYYKNPESIGHKVLADRIGEREPGNKPLPNDRIPYIYIQFPEKKGQRVLQGDKIEHPDFIKRNNLKPDYLFYITNQILKPVCQIYALILEDLKGYNHDSDYMNRLKCGLLNKHGEDKLLEKLTKKRNEMTADILFQDIIREATNKKKNIREITSWFKPV
uniref:DNA polymerase n=1 Tax=Mimiviridae sp. ChoanoV1 TaxID=2596887 RepID=A0A5B8IGT9_9VIRU|nr:DNA polymerase family B [Mimiviridae sp. ChoanoV1]